MIEREPIDTGKAQPATTLGWVRVLRRTGFVLLFCLLGDMLSNVALPTRRFAHDYRPEWYELPRYVRYLQDYRRAHPEQVIILFAGPSTAWGMGSRPGYGLPERFQRLLRERYREGPLSRAKVFNVCLVGNTPATDYYTLRALSGVADAIYLQLHYCSFSYRDALVLKPELLVALGQWPTGRQRMVLGGEWIRDSRRWGWDTAISTWLSQHWALWRDRVALRHLVYRDVTNPAQYLYDSYEEWMHITGREQRPQAAKRIMEREVSEELFGRGVTKRWEELSAQARAWLRAMTGWRFVCPALRPSNRGWTFVRDTVEMVQREGVPLFAYTAKVNRPLLEQEGLWDETGYRANAQIVARWFASRGVPLVDYNLGPPLPGAYYHDYTHLRDQGAAWQAERLYEDSRDFLEAIAG